MPPEGAAVDVTELPNSPPPETIRYEPAVCFDKRLNVPVAPVLAELPYNPPLVPVLLNSPPPIVDGAVVAAWPNKPPPVVDDAFADVPKRPPVPVVEVAPFAAPAFPKRPPVVAVF